MDLTIRQWLSDSTLDRTDAESLICFVLDKPRSYLFSHSDHTFSAIDHKRLSDIAERRSLGEPLAYITGSTEFFSHQFIVTPDVLIPRDDTGCLVETGVALLPTIQSDGLIVDAGTGSGAVAIAFASHTGLAVTAIDVSEKALAVAKRNAETLTPGLITCLESNWLTEIPDRSVRLLLSNPPYIAAKDPHLQAADLQHEPQSALVSGEDGLDDIRRLTQDAVRVLVPDAAVAFEHGFDQGLKVQAIFANHGFTDIATVQDLSGNDRVTTARLSNH